MKRAADAAEDPLGRAEFALSERTFALLAATLKRAAGIHLGPDKRPLLVARLGRRLRELSLPDFEHYARRLEDPARGAEEVQELVNRLTTNMTEFYRERAHFEYLLGGGLERLTAGRSVHEPLRVWCAAASTGQEPYTLAITLDRHFAPHTHRRVRLVASDVDTGVLEYARRGIYAERELEHLPRELWSAWFLRGRGLSEGRVRASDKLRQLVDFRRINLIDATYPFDAPLDVVFLRNVLIYFDAPTQQSIFERMHQVLRPGGLLVVGHSESQPYLREHFEVLETTIFRRPAEDRGAVRRSPPRALPAAVPHAAAKLASTGLYRCGGGLWVQLSSPVAPAESELVARTDSGPVLCAFDPGVGTGGLLQVLDRTADLGRGLERLVEALLAREADRNRLQTKLFATRRFGDATLERLRQAVAAAGLQLVNAPLEDEFVLEVQFDPQTGRVRLQRTRSDEAPTPPGLAGPRRRR
jgi:chemotaxis protein methyltransferase CheR